MEDAVMSAETVVDRLKAAGPSGIASPHCWFCGRIEAWFWCDCRDATDAREGKRAKPRVVERGGQMLIVLDPEVMARPHNQGRKRYVPAKKAAAVTPDPANSEPDANRTVANAGAANSEGAAPANGVDRKAYMRDLMRRRRATQKG